jgi:hypothetical protein
MVIDLCVGGGNFLYEFNAATTRPHGGIDSAQTFGRAPADPPP